MPVTLTLSTLTTLDQSDVELNAVTQSGSAVLTGGINMISERKKLYMEFSVDTISDPETETQLSLPGSSIYINFALFMPVGYAYSSPSGPPSTGFNFIIPDVEGGSPAEMYFYSNGSFEPDTCKNLKCTFALLTSTTYSVELEFYNTFDEGNYMNNIGKNNEYRFLSEFWNELNFDEISTSVYQRNGQIRILTYIKHSDEATDPGYSEKFEKTIYQGQSQHYGETLTLEDGSSNAVSLLNTIIDTDITATLTSENDYFIEFYGKLIRIQNNSALDFIENYELVEFEISPYAISYDIPLGQYTLDFTIDKDWLTAGANYRILILGYGEDGASAAKVIGGASGVLGTTRNVAYCDTPACNGMESASLLDIAGTINDIDNTYAGNELTCCIEERLQTNLTVDYSSDLWRNNLICRGWCDGECVGENDNFPSATNDIRKYLSYVYMEIYTEYVDSNLGGTVKNLLDQKIMTRTGVNTYSGGGISFSFNTSTEILSLSYPFRVRNEPSVPALVTYLNGSVYYPIQDNQYWGGPCLGYKDIYIKWRLVFYYHDIPTPFIDNLDYIQKLHVKEYEGSHMNHTNILDQDIICSEEQKCFTANIVIDGEDCSPTGSPEDYKLINTIELYPLTGVINEADQATPDIMAKLTHSAITNQQADFTGGDATFCIEGTELETGQRYKITSMAKKIK